MRLQHWCPWIVLLAIRISARVHPFRLARHLSGYNAVKRRPDKGFRACCVTVVRPDTRRILAPFREERVVTTLAHVVTSRDSDTRVWGAAFQFPDGRIDADAVEEEPTCGYWWRIDLYISGGKSRTCFCMSAGQAVLLVAGGRRLRPGRLHRPRRLFLWLPRRLTQARRHRCITPLEGGHITDPEDDRPLLDRRTMWRLTDQHRGDESTSARTRLWSPTSLAPATVADTLHGHAGFWRNSLHAKAFRSIQGAVRWAARNNSKSDPPVRLRL